MDLGFCETQAGVWGTRMAPPTISSRGILELLIGEIDRPSKSSHDPDGWPLE